MNSRNRSAACFPHLIFPRLRWHFRRIIDRLGDHYYGIETVTADHMPTAEEESEWGDNYVNGPVSYWIINEAISAGKLGPGDTFVDVGCGDGRVVCLAARRRLRKCVGIELSSRFAENARVNAAVMRGRLSPIEIKVGDAVHMDYSEGTCFFFGNPFGPSTMRAVLGLIGNTLTTHPRQVTSIFVLTKDERSTIVKEVLRSTTWLKSIADGSLSWSAMSILHGQSF